MSSFLNFKRDIPSTSALKKGTINIYAKATQTINSKTKAVINTNVISSYQFNFPGINTNKTDTRTTEFSSSCSDAACSSFNIYPVLISVVGKNFTNDTYTFISNISSAGLYLSFETNKITVKFQNLSNIGVIGSIPLNEEKLVAQINVLYEDDKYVNTTKEYYQNDSKIGVF